MTDAITAEARKLINAILAASTTVQADALVIPLLARVQELEADLALWKLDREAWHASYEAEAKAKWAAEARVRELERERDEARQAATELLQAVDVARTELANRSVLELDASERARQANAKVERLEREVTELKAKIAVDCTCRVIEKCERCEAIDKQAEPPLKRHYCGSSERLTACGRQRNKLPRGTTAFEWNYVTCPRCLATRPETPFT